MIVVGLGNPGAQYDKTRHNTGFMVLDRIAKKHEFPAFKPSPKYHALISEGTVQEVSVLLVKPQTHMNNSGKSVAPLFKNLETKSLSFHFIIIHDDIDILLGKIKVSTGRGSAGHKGIESIMHELGTKNFTRIRIGIQPHEGKPSNMDEFVLQKFFPEELPLLKKSLTDVSNWLLARSKEAKEKAERISAY